MAVHPRFPEMTQSQHAYNHGLATKSNKQTLSSADFRPTKPLPAASSTVSSRSSDDVACAVFNCDQPQTRPNISNIVSGERGHHAHNRSADLEKGSLGHEQYRSQTAQHPWVAEAHSPLRSPHRFQTGGRLAHGNDTVPTYECEGYESNSVEGKAMQILMYLSLFSPFVTCALSTYSLLVQLFLILISPLRLCTSRRTLSQQIIQHLAPPLQLQFRLIHSPAQQREGEYSASSLSLTHLLSPVVSVGVAVAAWVAAVFWFYAAILGDPDGKGGSNDGQATVLSVWGWWEAWLMRPIKR
ncbi:MAG: hypothetical protein M1836_004833 [Candelina mexicana]|nr:MAG: hypothetical protein M1836_004833 [Candelina mexicana]